MSGDTCAKMGRIGSILWCVSPKGETYVWNTNGEARASGQDASMITAKELSERLSELLSSIDPEKDVSIADKMEMYFSLLEQLARMDIESAKDHLAGIFALADSIRSRDLSLKAELYLECLTHLGDRNYPLDRAEEIARSLGVRLNEEKPLEGLASAMYDQSGSTGSSFIEETLTEDPAAQDMVCRGLSERGIVPYDECMQVPSALKNYK